MIHTSPHAIQLAVAPVFLLSVVATLLQLPERLMVENSFFEHLGLVGGFLLVAWLDLRKTHGTSIGDTHAEPQVPG